MGISDVLFDSIHTMLDELKDYEHYTDPYYKKEIIKVISAHLYSTHKLNLYNHDAIMCDCKRKDFHKKAEEIFKKYVEENS
jgi:hypothetical protein